MIDLTDKVLDFPRAFMEHEIEQKSAHHTLANYENLLFSEQGVISSLITNY